MSDTNKTTEQQNGQGVQYLSQWELIKLRFSRHKLAVISAYLLALLYAVAILAEFVAPQNPTKVDADFAYCPPQMPRFNFEHGLYVYAMDRHVNPVTLQDKYTENRNRIIDLGLFVKGDPYKLWGLIPMERHLIGVRGTSARAGRGTSAEEPVEMKGQRERVEVAPPQAAMPDIAGRESLVASFEPGNADRGTRHVSRFGHGNVATLGNQERQAKNQEPTKTLNTEHRTLNTFYLFGADRFGRDLFSRIIYGARISLSVGLVGIIISFTLGCLIGGISGYAGGWVDNLIQRFIEMMNAIPTLPLWIVLAGMMPITWSPLAVYFAITVVLSLLGWRGLARVVRGKIISLCEEDYAMAARLLGASRRRVLVRHLLPGMTSHILVSLSMTIPGMILGETGLSFLGLGLRPPVVSWGVLLQDCMEIEAVVSYSWLLMPVFFIILAVMCFNFVGDGLRDAADPYH